MTDKSMEVELAEVRGELKGISNALSEVKKDMATKEGQAAAGEVVRRVEAALQQERAARILAVADVQKDVNDLATEMKEMKKQQENRKYLVLSALLVGLIGLMTSIVSTVIGSGIGV